MIDYAFVLAYLQPDAEWALNNNDFETLQWFSDGAPPSRVEVEAAWSDAKRKRKADEVRRERDRLLTASDWTQVADAPVVSLEWQSYRQALRDVPQQSGFPDSVEWPQPPNE